MDEVSNVFSWDFDDQKVFIIYYICCGRENVSLVLASTKSLSFALTSSHLDDSADTTLTFGTVGAMLLPGSHKMYSA